MPVVHGLPMPPAALMLEALPLSGVAALGQDDVLRSAPFSSGASRIKPETWFASSGVISVW